MRPSTSALVSLFDARSDDLRCLGITPGTGWSLAEFLWRETLVVAPPDRPAAVREWRVSSRIRFDRSGPLTYTFWVHDVTQTHRCPGCQHAAFACAPTRIRMLRGARCETETHLFIEIPLVYCPDCGLHRLQVAWAEDRTKWLYVRSLSPRASPRRWVPDDPAALW